MDHERALDDIASWAASDENLRLVVLTGSAARGPGHVHRLSDLDVELYVRDPDVLLGRSEWYHRFGEVLAVEALENPGWHPTRLVYYVDGKIDFMVGPVQALASGIVYDREFRVLLDKDGFTDRLRLERAPASPPAADEFRRCVDWFTAAALMTARSIARDEPWTAKIRDRDLKDELLTMIEWDHRARYGWDLETWHLGMHMREWMDADVQASLDNCWATFSLDGTRRALLASVELFDRLCRRTAEELGFERFDADRVGAEIGRILRS